MDGLICHGPVENKGRKIGIKTESSSKFGQVRNLEKYCLYKILVSWANFDTDHTP